MKPTRKMYALFLATFVVSPLVFTACATKEDIYMGISNELDETIQSIFGVLNFMENYNDQLNFDAFFGVTLAQAQIEQALHDVPRGYDVLLNNINERYRNLLTTYQEQSAKAHTDDNLLFKTVLLRPTLWHNSVSFKTGLLTDFGLHSNWTANFIVRNKSANFHGLSSDQCLTELLEEDCKIGRDCAVMMLENRNDTLYLLTHRLLFMQLARGLSCGMSDQINYYTRKFCSLIWRDAKTIEYFNFPNMDLFLEQILLCGMEGYGEFFIDRWRTKPLSWQTEHGCYNDSPLSVPYQVHRRTANVIEFGCVDHTTGLGLATLSLNVRYLIYTMKNL